MVHVFSDEHSVIMKIISDREQTSSLNFFIFLADFDDISSTSDILQNHRWHAVDLVNFHRIATFRRRHVHVCLYVHLILGTEHPFVMCWEQYTVCRPCARTQTLQRHTAGRRHRQVRATRTARAPSAAGRRTRARRRTCL